MSTEARRLIENCPIRSAAGDYVPLSSTDENVHLLQQWMITAIQEMNRLQFNPFVPVRTPTQNSHVAGVSLKRKATSEYQCAYAAKKPKAAGQGKSRACHRSLLTSNQRNCTNSDSSATQNNDAAKQTPAAGTNQMLQDRLGQEGPTNTPFFNHVEGRVAANQQKMDNIQKPPTGTILPLLSLDGVVSPKDKGKYKFVPGCDWVVCDNRKRTTQNQTVFDCALVVKGPCALQIVQTSDNAGRIEHLHGNSATIRTSGCSRVDSKFGVNVIAWVLYVSGVEDAASKRGMQERYTKLRKKSGLLQLPSPDCLADPSVRDAVASRIKINMR